MSSEIPTYPFTATKVVIAEIDGPISQAELNRTYWVPDFVGSDAIGDTASYDADFSLGLREERVLQTYLEDRRRLGLITTALDLAGGNGQAIRSLAREGLITTGLTVNLTDIRSEEQKSEDENLGIGYVTGNLLRSSTWLQSIDPWTDEYLNEGLFTVIMARPGGAYRSKVPLEVYGNLFQKSLNRLDYKGGLFVATVPWNIPTTVTNRYTQEVNNFPGIDAKFVPDYTHFDLRSEGFRRTWLSGVTKIIKSSDEQFLVGENQYSISIFHAIL